MSQCCCYIVQARLRGLLLLLLLYERDVEDTRESGCGRESVCVPWVRVCVCTYSDTRVLQGETFRVVILYIHIHIYIYICIYMCRPVIIAESRPAPKVSFNWPRPRSQPARAAGRVCWLFIFFTFSRQLGLVTCDSGLWDSCNNFFSRIQRVCMEYKIQSSSVLSQY
jgi:hypothetical protein